MEQQQSPAQYIVSLVANESGQNVYEFVQGLDFFRAFDPECSFLDSRVVVHGKAVLQQDTWTFTFTYKGFITVPCDRCLEPLNCEVETTSTLFVKISDREPRSMEEDWWVLPPEEETADISQHIYDAVILSLPMQRIHKDNADGVSTCNAEMLQKLFDSKTSEKKGTMWEQLNALKNEIFKEQ